MRVSHWPALSTQITCDSSLARLQRDGRVFRTPFSRGRLFIYRLGEIRLIITFRGNKSCLDSGTKYKIKKNDPRSSSPKIVCSVDLVGLSQDPYIPWTAKL